LVNLAKKASALYIAWIAKGYKPVTTIPDPHPLLEQGYWLSQIVLATIGLVAAISAVIAARFAYKQVQAFRLFELLGYIESQNVRDARRVVLLEIRPLKDGGWWVDARLDNAASTVAASYANLGHVIQFERRRGRNDKVGEFFLENWADSIGPAHDTLESFLANRRLTQPTAYRGFTWLAKEAARYRHRQKNSI
jgi:hypothetical protein